MILRTFCKKSKKCKKRAELELPKALVLVLKNRATGLFFCLNCGGVYFGINTRHKGLPNDFNGFGGYLVTQISNLMSAIDSASQNNQEKDMACHKVRFGEKVLF